MVVKGGILDAKKHSTVVFQEKVNSNLARASDSSELADAEVSFVGSMLKASYLISSELNGQEAKILTNEEGERPNISATGRHCEVKAGAIIANLGLEKSHHMEVIDFSRGIWLGWRETLDLEVIGNHPQFILVCIYYIHRSMSIFIAFVYGSPDRQKRKLLWRDLLLSIPSGFYHWMAIGDFNAILSSSDKKGG
ncbi:hypothetical protein Goklo_015782 [Gossypium klotzschianum]|uniref:Endonuclease/exonuclease/phosphatase domain-containing protein n=2 Tax=Gossypium TaxID=3633 RepID=A0A7J8UBY5_9ROSI|nr:hypothetical protein [Gossypium klotzschianum]